MAMFSSFYESELELNRLDVAMSQFYGVDGVSDESLLRFIDELEENNELQADNRLDFSRARRNAAESGHRSSTAKDRLNMLMAQRRRDRSSQSKYTLAQQVRDSVEEFCATTSAHGLPRVAAASGMCQRFLWSMIFALCLAAFLGQAYMIVDKFNRNEKIVNVELKFEKMPFPAVTVCNLNPFKRSLAEKAGPVMQMLEALEGALVSSESPSNKNSKGDHRSKRYTSRKQLLQVIEHECDCDSSRNDCSARLQNNDNVLNMNLLQKLRHNTTLNNNITRQSCICVHNTVTDSIWPCYRIPHWSIDTCSNCNGKFGICSRNVTLTTGDGIESDSLAQKLSYFLDTTPKIEERCWCENVTSFCVLDDRIQMKRHASVTSSTGSSQDGAIPIHISSLLLKSNWPTQPVHVSCYCDSTQHCHPVNYNQHHNSIQISNSSSTLTFNSCVCAFHSDHEHIDHCAPSSNWQVRQCTQCNHNGICAMPDQSLASSSSWQSMCLCDGHSFTCIALDATVHRPQSSHFTYLQMLPNLTLPDQQPSKPNKVKRETPLELFEMNLMHLRSGARDLTMEEYENQKMYPSMVSCYCESPTRGTCLIYKEKVPANVDEKCICPLTASTLENVFARNVKLWPCYPASEWHSRLCPQCHTMRDCKYVPASNAYAGNSPCLCVDHIRMCIKLDWTSSNLKNDEDKSVFELLTKDGSWLNEMNETIIKVWEVTASTPTESPVEQQQKEEALGFQGMKDVVAIRSKARENLIFATSQMNESEKSAISTPKHEFIKQCSFNGRECSVDEDFELHVDPTFGNCFTFNAGESENMTSDRAGPNYGLRLQIFVNTSEYLPTTEASGVRITVHPADEEPFPDTIGFSAPVGSVSGFGIHLKRVDRLPKPYGDCVKDGKTDNFIYRDKSYTVEGCHRSCMQHYLIKQCDCGDPRFPTVNGSSACPLDNLEKRKCLTRNVELASKMRGNMDNCTCHQPCEQYIYSVSYSAATWPASHVQVNCTDFDDTAECLKYYRNEGVMIEIFYEALNYEALKETDAYGWPNLLSDFGGQLGLWMGVSVITCMEFLILCWSLITICFCCGRAQTYSVNRHNGAVMTAGDDPAMAMPLYKSADGLVHNGNRIPMSHLDRNLHNNDNSFFLV